MMPVSDLDGRITRRAAVLGGAAVAITGCTSRRSKLDPRPPSSDAGSPPPAAADTPSSASASHRSPTAVPTVTVQELAERSAPDRQRVYKTVDGDELVIDLFTPPGTGDGETTAGSGDRPAMLLIHGGAWVNPGRQHTALHARYFARRGMVVGNVQYRLATTETGWSVVHALRDVRDAFETIRDRAGALGVDPERIVAAGESAGGHLAAALGMLPGDPQGVDGTPATPAALALYNPVLDLTTPEWIAPGGDLQLFPADETAQPWAEQERRLSPIEHVRGGQPPTLLLHGTADRIVPIEAIDRFADRYRNAGNKLQYERLDGREHAFALYLDADDRADVARSLWITDRFLADRGLLHGSPAIPTCRLTATPSC
jgi:acetyl esterase